MMNVGRVIVLSDIPLDQQEIAHLSNLLAEIDCRHFGLEVVSDRNFKKLRSIGDSELALIVNKDLSGESAVWNFQSQCNNISSTWPETLIFGLSIDPALPSGGSWLGINGQNIFTLAGSSLHEITPALLSNAIGRFQSGLEGERKRKEEELHKAQERVEKKAEKFVEDALAFLHSRESKHMQSGNRWYLAGFIMLGISISMALVSFSIAAPGTLDGIQAIQLGVRSIIVMALLIATVKYCFDLGKANMSEALRLTHRQHAINFGKFYLEAYGAKATWTEVKDAFATWNINSTSAFAELKSESYDPRLVELAVSVAKLVSDKAKEK